MVEQDTNQNFRFNLSFKGNLIENSVDAFDVANTILALSTAITSICEIEYGDEAKDKIKLNVNAFTKGSLITDFLLYVATPVGFGALVTTTNEAKQIGLNILETVRGVIEVKKLLKGNKPKEVKTEVGDRVTIIAKDNAQITINLNTLKAVQDLSINKSIEKAFSPLTVENSEIFEIKISTDQSKDFEPLSVDREVATYLKSTQETQTITEIKYKGVVSKIDTKTRSGYLSIGSKRLSFGYLNNLPQEDFEIMINSMRSQIQIYLIGEVQMDYESNPKNMLVKSVTQDKDLFS